MAHQMVDNMCRAKVILCIKNDIETIIIQLLYNLLIKILLFFKFMYFFFFLTLLGLNLKYNNILLSNLVRIVI